MSEETIKAGGKRTAGELTVEVKADVADALKGIKALNRELRETVKLLGVIKEVQEETGILTREFMCLECRHKIKGSLTRLAGTLCPKCNGPIVETSHA